MDGRMTISIVQMAKISAQFVTSLALTAHFSSPPTAGNRIIVWHFSAGNRSEGEAPLTWSRFYFDRGARPDRDPNLRPPRLSGWWNEADPAWQDISFTVPNVSSYYALVAYEIAGEFDPELSMVQGWTRGTTDTATTLTMDNDGPLTVPEHAAVFAVTGLSSNASGFTGETFTGDRTDAVTCLRSTVALDATAGDYSNTVTYTPSTKATGVVFALMDRGEPYVSAAHLPARLAVAADNATAAAAELPGSAADLLLAADDITAGASGVAALVDEKDDKIATLQGREERVLLAPHGPVLDAYAWSENPYTPDPGRELDGPEVGALVGHAMAGLTSDQTLHIPTGRYRIDMAQTIVTDATNITVQGQGLGLNLPTFYHVTIGHDPVVAFLGIDGLTIRNYRTESTNLDVDPKQTEFPIHEDHFPVYKGNVEGDHAVSIESCNNVVVEDYFAYGMWGDGIEWNQASKSGAGNSTNVVATRVDNRYCGRQAFTCSGLTGAEFTYIWLPNAKRSGVDFEDGPSDQVSFAHGLTNVQGGFWCFNCNGPSSTNISVTDWDIAGGKPFRWASGGAAGERPGLVLDNVRQATGRKMSSIVTAHQPGAPYSITNCTIPLGIAIDNPVFADMTNGLGCFHVEDNDFSATGTVFANRLTYGGTYLAGDGFTIVGRNNRYSSGVRAREVVVGLGVAMTGEASGA